MRMWLIGSIIVLITLILVVFGDVRRLLITGWLILEVTPYEWMVPDAPRILIAGDSTGYGTGAGRGATSVAGYLGTDWPSYTIENMSVNGRTIGGLKTALEELPNQAAYELILLQIGGNDILRNREVAVVEAELRAALRAARARAAHVIMMSSGNVGAASAFTTNGQPDPVLEARTRTFRELFLRVTAEEGVMYVDLFEEPADDVFLREPRRYLAADGLHPSAAGYYLWYQSLKPVLEPILNAKTN